jgi:hypothetical protein
MRRTTVMFAAASAATAIMLTMTAGTAGAVIHEQVAAYCSGGGHGTITASSELEPPGIADPTKKNFASPVVHNGVVDLNTLTITDSPQAKFPEGTSVFDANIGATTPDHPSTNCKALQP